MLISNAFFKSIRLIVLSVFIVCVVVACVVAPLDGKEVPAKNTLIPVVGFWGLPSKKLNILAAPTPLGPWTVLTTVTTSRSPMSYGSRRLYSFNARVSVPEELWRRPSGGCATGEVYLGVGFSSSHSQPALITFEEESLSGVNPFQCLEDNDFNAGKCAGNRSPVSRLLVGSNITQHVSDINIRSHFDYARYRCAASIDGNLRVDSALGEIDFPELRRVSGNVILEHPVRPPPDNPYSLHVGNAVPRNMPQLLAVGGNLELNSYVIEPPPSTAGYTVRRLALNMPLLKTVGGNLSLNNVEPDGANGSFSGLESIREIGGDLRFSSHTDRFISALRKLKRVGGTLYAGVGRVDHGGVMPELTSIGGDLDMPATRVRPGYLPALSRVEGDARLSFHLDLSRFGPTSRNLVQLSHVGGSLILEGSVRERFAIGAAPISVGRLVVENNNRLIDFAVGEVQVREAGDIRFVNNPVLCRSHIDRFISSLTSWAGVSVISANDERC